MYGSLKGKKKKGEKKGPRKVYGFWEWIIRGCDKFVYCCCMAGFCFYFKVKSIKIILDLMKRTFYLWK